MTMELDQPYEFILEDDSVRTVVVLGTCAGPNGTIMTLEVDGVRGDYSGLEAAIGPYVSYAPV